MNDSEKRELLKRALKQLPEGCEPIYPLRTRFIHACQVLEASGEEILEHIHERGEPEDADMASLNIVSDRIDRAYSAAAILGLMVEELEEKGGGN